MTKLRILSINIFLSIIAIGITTLTFYLDRFWPFQLPSALVIVGWPLVAVGSILILFAAVTLARHSGSTGAPGDPTKELVTIGPYRWVRNPIYLGEGFIILGLALIMRSPSLIVACIVYLFVINLYVRKVEEPATESRFSEVYDRYKQQVPRWFPWLNPMIRFRL